MKKPRRSGPLQDNPFEATPTRTAPFALPPPNFMTVAAIRQHNTLSRTQVAETIGYSPSKITTVVGDLIADGILEEKGEGPATGARRAKKLGFNPLFGYVVAARVGFSKLEIALVDFSEHIRVRQMLPLPQPADPDNVLSEICRVVHERIDKLNIPMSDVLAFSLIVPGAVDQQHGTLFDSPLMPSWGGYQIESLIRESFPYAMVHVENEANAMAYGELRKGGAQDIQSLLYVNVGVSLNAGIIVDGHIYRGSNGRAGDIGHFHVMHQPPGGPENVLTPLEAVVSGTAIVKQVRQLSQDETDDQNRLALHDRMQPSSVREIGMAATEGDARAQQIIQHSGHVLGDALANIVNLLDPALVLIGGPINDVAPAFLASVRRSVWDRSPSLATQPLRIEAATLGPEGGMLGAIALALEGVFVSQK